jgi:hypothetical protein
MKTIVGLRKLILSVAGLLTLCYLAAMKTDPAYAYVVAAITVPAFVALLGERFGKGFLSSKQSEDEHSPSRE